MDEKTPLVTKDFDDEKHQLEDEGNEILASGIYAEYIGSQSGHFHQSRNIEESNGKGCRRPKFIEPVVLLFYLAFNCTVPIQEQFITEIISNHYRNGYDWSTIETTPMDKAANEHHETCHAIIGNKSNPLDILIDDIVQSQSSLWLMYIKLANTIPAVLTTLIICSYGDLGGRKIGILFPAIGSAFKILIFIFTILLDAPITTLLIGSFVEGAFGSHLTFMGSSYAYMADTVPAPKRALRFTILQTANVLAGLAHIPFGYWIDASGFLQPFWFVVGVYIFTIFYTVLLLPESYPPKDPNEEEKEDEHPGPGVLHLVKRAIGSFTIYSAKNHNSRRTQIALVLLLSSFACRVLFEMGKSAVETLYMLAAPLCMSSTLIGIFNALNSFVHGVFGLIGVAILIRCVNEVALNFGFTLSAVAGRVMWAYTNHVWMLFVYPFVSFGQTATLSLTRAMMSKLVAPNQQGALFATIFTLESVCDVFSGTLFNTIYAATVSNFKGLVFLVQAGILGLGAIFLLIYYFVIHFRKGDLSSSQKHIIVSEKQIHTST